MSDLAQLRVRDDPAIRDALSWYIDVAENRCPAKFRIAATVALHLDPAASSEDALWAELDELTPIFLTRWQAIRAGARLPPATEGPSLLELCRELAYRMLTHCNFCPWNCRIDRVAGAKFGACKLASGSRVSSHFHHTGEELFYRGTEGSGTIFFTSCNMRCAFCQNGDISTDKGQLATGHTRSQRVRTGLLGRYSFCRTPKGNRPVITGCHGPATHFRIRMPPWRAFAAAQWSAIGPKLPIRDVRSMVAFVGTAAGSTVTRRLGL
jgi:hypothetical protein